MNTEKLDKIRDELAEKSIRPGRELLEPHEADARVRHFKSGFDALAEHLIKAMLALEFYASKDNWLRDENGWRHDMIISDLDDESLNDWDGRFSGKKARAVLAEIKKELGEVE